MKTARQMMYIYVHSPRQEMKNPGRMSCMSNSVWSTVAYVSIWVHSTCAGFELESQK